MNQASKKKLNKTSFVIPFTQFDWGDYFSDTDYLDFDEHGIYWNLLKRYYTTGPFENDMAKLKRVTKCPINKVDAMQMILEEFFFILEEDGCWHHKRCDEEIVRAKGTSEIQSQRARKGVAKQKRSTNGQFTSHELSPAGAGHPPAIKDEDIIIKETIDKERINEDLIYKELRQGLDYYE
ncbi:MAG: DUF1376 domain-containing protein [Methylophilaceae bacterium]|nr:DUF1376 domain-containing protein [Methylophilaceae bacterium]